MYSFSDFDILTNFAYSSNLFFQFAAELKVCENMPRESEKTKLIKSLIESTCYELLFLDDSGNTARQQLLLGIPGCCC